MKYIVDIHGEIDGDYEIIKKYDEPKTGEWIDSGYGVECSLCGEWYPHASIARNQLNFCPNCGADMRPQFEEPEINPCRGCEDYDGKGGCKTKGGCADRRGDLGD